MDIYCPKCGEPWELDSLHEEASHRGAPDFNALSPEAKRCAGSEYSNTPKPGLEEYKEYSKEYASFYSKVQDDFRKKGCAALSVYTNGKPCEPVSERQADRAHLSAELMDVLGDDFDGVASMMDDAEYMGLI